PAADSSVVDPIAPMVDQSQPDATFRSAYRFNGTDIVALDARQLPGRVQTLVLSEPSEVASAIRAGAINAGPVLAEVGAYGLVMAARAAVARPDVGRDQQVRAAADTLRAAKREVHALRWAVDRLESLYLELAGQAIDPTALADRLESEADSIATTNVRAQLEIARIGADLTGADKVEPIDLLMHGDMGPLSCGAVGMGTALIQQLRDRDHEVRVWLTDAAPSGEGGRVAAYQLRQLDVPFSVIPDSALGWLFDRHRLDAVLLRGDRVAADGDCGVLVGGLSAAIVAAAADVPVHVLAPRNAFDPGAADGAAMRVDAAFLPTSDVLPAQLITRVISETQS
ncbi:MAG: hypothetical protein QFC55_07545, partial [Chloroflexota bacterium]|nr:hypothetical protein [Chloroflexota bacterium]